MVEVRREVRPAWPFRLPRAGTDGVMRRRRDGGLERMIHVEGVPGVVPRRPARARPRGARWPEPTAPTSPGGLRADALRAGRRRRPAPLLRGASASDPLDRADRSARARTCASSAARAVEALAWAICEQLIEAGAPTAIERRIVARLGPALRATGLRDLPAAATLAGARRPCCSRSDLRAGRAIALRRAAPRSPPAAPTCATPTTSAPGVACARSRRSAAGRSRCSPCTARGATTSCPAGDLGYLRVVGRIADEATRGARVSGDEVRAFFAPYGLGPGLAEAHVLGKSAS